VSVQFRQKIIIITRVGHASKKGIASKCHALFFSFFSTAHSASLIQFNKYKYKATTHSAISPAVD
jgi:hypothetical protein